MLRESNQASLSLIKLTRYEDLTLIDQILFLVKYTSGQGNWLRNLPQSLVYVKLMGLVKARNGYTWGMSPKLRQLSRPKPTGFSELARQMTWMNKTSDT